MNPLAETAAKSIQRETGARFDPISDYAALRQLDALADKVTAPYIGTDYQATLWPQTTIGGATFKRLSLGLDEFIDQQVRQWYRDNVRKTNLALFFCMAHTGPEDLPRIWDFHDRPKDFWREVRGWLRTLHVDYSTLCNGMRDFLLLDSDAREKLETPKTPNTPGRFDPEAPTDMGWLAEIMVKEYGQTVDYWVWQAPLDHVRLCLKNHERRRRKEQRQHNIEDTNGEPNDPEDPYIRNLRDFRMFEAELKAELEQRACQAKTEVGAHG